VVGSEKQQDDYFERESGMRRVASAPPTSRLAVRDGRDGRPRQLEMNRWRIYRLVRTGRRRTSKGSRGGSGGRVVFTATESCRREAAAVGPARWWLSVGWRAPHRVLKGSYLFFSRHEMLQDCAEVRSTRRSMKRGPTSRHAGMGR
jgi:hypothetical protein